MEHGESLTVIRSFYEVTSIKPCTLEKGRKMAKVRLKNPPKDILERLEKGPFDEVKIDASLKVANLRLGKKRILVFSSGEVSIRAAENDKDILETAELLAKLLQPHS